MINPLLKLLKRLRPVSTAITITIRPCFRVPSSGSIETLAEFPDVDWLSELRGLSKEERCGKIGSGAEEMSLLFVGTSSIADNNCDMISISGRLTLPI